MTTIPTPAAHSTEQAVARTIGAPDGPGGLITLLTSTAESHGAFLLLEIRLAAGMSGSGPLHYHLRQTERFEVLDGRLHLRVGKERRILGPGDTAFVPARTNHCFYTTDSPATLRAELRPAGTFEQGMRLAAEMGTALYRRPLLLPLILQQTETYFPGIPLAVQRPVIAALAALARRIYGPALARDGF
jgi:mannose-6-phosphate isomerase-like protein (cupin superfamily)